MCGVVVVIVALVPADPLLPAFACGCSCDAPVFIPFLNISSSIILICSACVFLNRSYFSSRSFSISCISKPCRLSCPSFSVVLYSGNKFLTMVRISLMPSFLFPFATLLCLLKFVSSLISKLFCISLVNLTSDIRRLFPIMLIPPPFLTSSSFLLEIKVCISCNTTNSLTSLSIYAFL
ncbi:hypothetical protein WN66_01708 [Saccharomyces cerevisiae]|nr:hypothetical protein WN66_01708 [Saccharomyces cerevisiae]